MIFSLPCLSSSLRGRLKHSVLENIILRLAADTLSRICVEEPSEIERCREAAISFRDSLPHGFSPVCLLDTNHVLLGLDGMLREKLERRLNELYVERFFPELRYERVNEKVEAFLMNIDAFEHAARAGANERWLQAHARLLETATVLLTELERLPQGVWLPCP